MILKHLFLLLLLFISFDFAEDFLTASSIIKPEYVIKKLETVPVAYYGWEGDYRLYNEELMKMENFDAAYPSIYKAFVGWKEKFQERQKRLLVEAPEIYRKTFELHKKTDIDADFYLIHNVIHVDLVYDKNTKTWHAPNPEESKKSIFVFGYIGPDILKDSTSWFLVHRLLVLPPRTLSWRSGNVKKHIYFLDGFSESCTNFDNCSHENARYFPYRLKYDVQPNLAIDVRKRMESFILNGDYSAAGLLADSADMSVRSKILLKILNHDYEFIKNNDSTQFYLDRYNNYAYADSLDNLLETIVQNQNENGSYCASLQNISRKDSALVCEIVQRIASEERPDYIFSRDGQLRFNMDFDVGKQFLFGNYSGVDPSWYLGSGINIYVNNFVFGMGFAFRNFESKCDSCKVDIISIFSTVGFLWFKTKYIESVAFSNIGFSTYNVSVSRTNNEKEHLNESFFLYGIGVYFDLLFPNHIGAPSKGKSSVNRFGARLKLGFHNMNISDAGHVKGVSPYVSLGFTWLLVGMESKYQRLYKPRTKFLHGSIYLGDVECEW